MYNPSIQELRKDKKYRFLESLLGIAAFVFFGTIILVTVISPVIAALFLILYSLAWLLRVAMIASFTIMTYRTMLRWHSIDTQKLLYLIDQKDETVVSELTKIKNKFRTKFFWASKINELIINYNKLPESRSKPSEFYHILLMPTYNEPSSSFIKSLKAVQKTSYRKDRILIVISQEARAPQGIRDDLIKDLTEVDWINLIKVENAKVLNGQPQNYFTTIKSKLLRYKLGSDKINIIVTEHPDGLEREIIGKASNEDWAGRVGNSWIEANNIEPEKVLVTSLDVDSAISDNFFALLSFRYALCDSGTKSGFQAVPVYTKNINEATVLARIVVFNTTMWQISQNNLDDKTLFFANYSVPLDILREVDFWEKEYIAEDFLFYSKCFTHYDGNFKVLPFYGYFNGDAVVGEDYGEAISNQYKQLQRWSWGGVEGLPYMIRKLFWVKNKIPLLKKISTVTDVFLSHHFWATAAPLFSFGMFLPFLLGGEAFDSTSTSLQLTSFLSYFAVISYLFVALYLYLSFDLTNRTLGIKESKKSFSVFIIIAFQFLILPFIQSLMSIPALDSQIRGVRGKYLGYWVTPKK
jgi:Glycosyl transferase family group 2